MPDTSDDPRVERSRAQLDRRPPTLLRTHDGRGHLSVRAVRRGRGQPADLLPALREPRRGRRGRHREPLPAAARRAPDADEPETSYRLLLAWLTELDAERGAWQHTIGSGTAFAASRDSVESWLADRLAERAPEAGSPVLRYAAAGFLGAVRAWLLQDAGPERPTAPELADSLVEVSARVLSPVAPPRPEAGSKASA